MGKLSWSVWRALGTTCLLRWMRIRRAVQGSRPVLSRFYVPHQCIPNSLDSLRGSTLLRMQLWTVSLRGFTMRERLHMVEVHLQSELEGVATATRAAYVLSAPCHRYRQ